MAVIHRETLRHNGNSVANGVVLGLRNGFGAADGQTNYLSTRHPSWHPIDSDPTTRYGNGEYTPEPIAVRAGRPGCLPGGVASRRFAGSAKRTTRSGWPTCTTRALTQAVCTAILLPIKPAQGGALGGQLQHPPASGRPRMHMPASSGTANMRGGIGSRIPPVVESFGRAAG